MKTSFLCFQLVRVLTILIETISGLIKQILSDLN